MKVFIKNTKKPRCKWDADPTRHYMTNLGGAGSRGCRKVGTRGPPQWDRAAGYMHQDSQQD